MVFVSLWFLSQSKNMHSRCTGNSKLVVGVCMSEYEVLCVFQFDLAICAGCSTVCGQRQL